MTVDLHIHLIPEIDDGAQSLAVSRRMLGRLAANGITRVIATPHLMEPLTPDYYREALEGLELLRTVAPEDLSVDLGFEHLLSVDTVDRLVAGEPSTLAGSRAVLVELAFSSWPASTGLALFNLRKTEYRPILAHPERYVAVRNQPDLVVDAALQGAALQLTSGSFAGVYGKEVAGLARQLLADALDRDLLVVLSSDAHSDGSRLTSVQPGHDWIEHNIQYGSLVLQWASVHVPTALLSDQPALSFSQWLAGQDLTQLPPPEPLPSSDRRGIGKLFGRRERRGSR